MNHVYKVSHFTDIIESEFKSTRKTLLYTYTG